MSCVEGGWSGLAAWTPDTLWCPVDPRPDSERGGGSVGVRYSARGGDPQGWSDSLSAVGVVVGPRSNSTVADRGVSDFKNFPVVQG